MTAADAEAELVALRPPPATFERWIKPISSYGLRKDSTGVMRFVQSLIGLRTATDD